MTQLRIVSLERRQRLLSQPWDRGPFHRELRAYFRERSELLDRCELAGTNGDCAGPIALCWNWHPDEDYTTDRRDYLELCAKHHKENDVRRLYAAAKLGNLILRRRTR